MCDVNEEAKTKYSNTILLEDRCQAITYMLENTGQLNSYNKKHGFIDIYSQLAQELA